MTTNDRMPDESPGAVSKLYGRVVFLVGARRSGTNWLERILTTHPEIVAMPSETYLFSHGVRPLTELIQHTNPGSQMMSKTYMERESFRAAVRELVDRVLLQSLERLGPDARYLLERTPWHAQHLPVIAEIYPDARVVHLIRDGRAVARSLVKLPSGPPTMADAAQEWRAAVAGRAEGRDLFADRYVEVRYEELLADPVRGAAALFEWLDVSAGPTLLERVDAEARAKFNVDPGSPDVRTDKWRNELSDADLAEIYREAGSDLRDLGYWDGQPPDRAAPASGDRVATPWRRARSAVRRPRAASSVRDLRRQARAELLRNLATVERFAGLVAAGDDDGAATLCEPDGVYRLSDDGVAAGGRGKPALATVLAGLRAHYDAGLVPINSDTRSSRRAFTIVLTYRLDDGREFAQTTVYAVKQGVLRSIVVYRFERARRPDG